MTIVENHVKFGEVVIFDHEFYLKNYKLSFKFLLLLLDFDGVFQRKTAGGGGGLGVVTDQGDTCINISKNNPSICSTFSSTWLRDMSFDLVYV